MKDYDSFIKIVIVGDPEVGKTSFLSSFLRKPLATGNESNLYNNVTTQFIYNEVEYEFSIWDTPGAPERKKLRCLAYPNTDVFIVCYSVDNRESFENVKLKWLPELRRRCPGVPRILLGLKSDLKQKVPNTVSEKEGEIMQMEIQAQAFYEFTIISLSKLNFIFTEAVECALRKKLHFRKNSCSIQ